MKYCVFCVAAGLVAASYGWGLGDALKAVDKATATVNEVNDSLKSSAQQVRSVENGVSVAPESKVNVEPRPTNKVMVEDAESQTALNMPAQHAVDSESVVLTYRERSDVKRSCQSKIRDAYYGKRISDGQKVVLEAELSRFDGASVKVTRKEADDYCADLDRRLKKAAADTTAEQQAATEKRASAEKQLAAERQADAEKQAAEQKRQEAERQAAAEKRLMADRHAEARQQTAESERRTRTTKGNVAGDELEQNSDPSAKASYDDWIACNNYIWDAYRFDETARNAELAKARRLFYGKDVPADTCINANDFAATHQMACEFYKDLKTRLDGVADYEQKINDLKQQLEKVLDPFWRDGDMSYEDAQKIVNDLVKDKNTGRREDIIKRLQDAVNSYGDKVSTMKADREALSVKTEAALKYADDNCRHDDYQKEGLLTPEHKAELLKLLNGVTQAQLASLVRERNDMLLVVAAQLITDQKVLEDLLVTNTKWVKGGYRDGLFASDFRNIYYQLYRNVTDQELLMKLLNQDEISFSTESSGCYGYRTPAVLRQMDKAHIDLLNRQRIARRRAAHGKTIDVMGFYIGMPRQDFELLVFTRGLTDDDVTGSFGTWKKGPANRIWLGHKYNANFMDIVKDGVIGLTAFTSRFVPGGEDNAGEIHLNGDVKDTYDIANEEVGVRVDTFWWRTCPKLGCKIKLYDGGNIVVESDETDVKLDLSEAEKWMNEDFDETELDASSDASSSGGMVSIMLFLVAIGGVLYFMRDKIDAFVAKNPKYTKAWSMLCAVGRQIKSLAMAAYRFASAKYKAYKDKKSQK